MTYRNAFAVAVVASAMAVPVVLADDAPAARNVTEMKFANFPGMPTCTTGSVQSGDPSKGASVIAAKMATGCSIPWHWHTPTERVMVVSGTAKAEMKGSPAKVLTAGAFALMPSHHLHQFTCTRACTLYIYSDAAFDIHYVDKAEKEIAPEEALKAVKETPAAPPAAK
jgi:quercetin dioxygenase-like cupin family protein